MDRKEADQAQVAALLDDFKARWAELLNFENENNRWSTLYVTALVVIIGWILNNDRYRDLNELLDRGQNAYFVLLLAFVNNLYTLGMSIKGYQIQQIGLYLFDEVRPRINALTGGDFNTWDCWRRAYFQAPSRRGRPELVRAVYYTSVATLPALVSAAILMIYFVYRWFDSPWYSVQNTCFYLVVAAVVVTFGACVSTTSVNKRWESVCNPPKPEEAAEERE